MLCAGSVALGQDELSSEQLRRMYDDAVAQLRTAQDRRNELAKENQKLRDRIAELEKQVKKAESDRNLIADKTFQARAEREAFLSFLAINPSIRLQWQIFMEKSLLAVPGSADPLGTDWPLPDKPRR